MGEVSSGSGSGAKNSMRVLYLISVLGQGRGGHYHSLNHISRELGSQVEAKILTIGPGSSEIIDSNPYFLRRILFNGVNIIPVVKKMMHILKDFKPDVIHCFDVTVYNFARSIMPSSKYVFVLNKCGGPNPIDFPRVENLILFSKENEIWFRNNPNFVSSKVYLIPNRVRKISVQEIKKFVKPTDLFSFVRICRIGNFYKKSIIDSITLIDVLNSQEIKAKLFIIGKVQDEEIYQDLLAYSAGKEVEFIVEDQHTTEASRLLYLADAVIATGRGAMEASSLGLPILTPAKNSDIPILINRSNFSVFFKTNFSERNVARESDLRNNLQLIEQLILDGNIYKDCSEFVVNCFNSYFDVSKVASKYIDVYENSLLRANNISALSDIILKIKTFRKFYINRESRDL